MLPEILGLGNYLRSISFSLRPQKKKLLKAQNKIRLQECFPPPFCFCLGKKFLQKPIPHLKKNQKKNQNWEWGKSGGQKTLKGGWKSSGQKRHEVLNSFKARLRTPPPNLKNKLIWGDVKSNPSGGGPRPHPRNLTPTPPNL